jgi:hypothetical protein
MGICSMNKRLLSKAFRGIFLYTGMLLACGLFLTPSASASGGAISQSFDINTNNVTTGTLLSLVPTGKNTVTPANDANANTLVGVVGDKPLLELSNHDNSTEAVQAVVSGSALALVSDMNGEVKVGDRITTSPISGIGMKATASAEIVGVAQSDLSSVSTVKKSVKDQDNKDVTVTVGLLPVAVDIAYYSSAPTAQGTISTFVPPFLQSIANAVTGNQVSPLRVLLGALTVALGFATAVIMLYVSIRSSITAIGRNPLAQGALRKGLVDVGIAAMGVLVITTVLSYAILSR